MGVGRWHAPLSHPRHPSHAMQYKHKHKRYDGWASVRTLETNLGLGLVSLGESAKATETGMRTVLNLCCTKKLRIVSIEV